MQMKIDYIAHELKPEAFDVWNTFVDTSPQGDVFCYTWWLDAITKGNFKIVAIFEKDEIVAGMPLAYYLGKINEPPLTRTLGPLFKPLTGLSERDKTTIQRKWLNLLLDEIPLDEFEQFCTSHHFNDWLPFRWRGLKQSTRYTYIIDYQKKSIDDIWQALNENKKRDLKKARQNKLSVQVIDDAHLFYQLVEQTYQRQGLTFRFAADDFMELDEAVNKNNSRKIFLASDENGRPHAAVYVAHNDKSAYYLLAGNKSEYRKLGGGTLALWEAIRYFHSRVTFFNFGGSDIERIEKYVRGFGGELQQYFHIYKDHPQIREVEKVIKKEVVREVPVLPPAPPDNWKYHLNLIMRHSWVLVKKALYKINIRFNLPVRVSVIVPCYNHGKFIHEMLQSVLKQTYPFYEVIIVNDGSTDDTADILNRIKHKKVRIFHTANHGPAHARNIAIENAKGDLIVNLDADNKIAGEFLEQCVTIMDNHPNVGIVYSRVECFGATSGIYQIPEYNFENMLRWNCIDGNACFRKSDWERTEGYKINMHYGYEDYDFWLSILELGREVHKIDQTMVYYRTYEDPKLCRSGRRKQNQYQMETVVVQAFRNHREFYKRSPEIYEEFCVLEKELEAKSYPGVGKSQFPTFSIITPTNKRPDLLKRNIESIRKQSFQDWEQIIVDDANDP
jgi:glycosyltransferase involved in cell wall biosynthesis